MSTIQVHVGVYFLGQYSATIVVSDNQRKDQEYQFDCLLTFANYTMRTLRSLGQTEEADGLARSLASTSEAHILAMAAMDRTVVVLLRGYRWSAG